MRLRGVVAACFVLPALAFAGCKEPVRPKDTVPKPLPPVPPVPQFRIAIDGATTPTSSPGAPIEITGPDLHLGTVGATVFFEQGDTLATLDFPGAALAGDSIVVTVPPTLSAPGTVVVYVVMRVPAPGFMGPGSRDMGSNAIELGLAPPPAFSPSSVAWSETTPLPGPVRAHAAVSAPASGGEDWVFVLGGNDGTANVASVLVAALDATGKVGPWRATSPLPERRAFGAAAVADATRAPVAAGTAFIYVAGGQRSADDPPGEETSIFIGAVDAGTGEVSWTLSGQSLPQGRLGARAVVANGYLHVTGGLGVGGGAVAVTVSAPILPDGSLGPLVEGSAARLPIPVAFHESFAHDGFLFVLGGDLGPVAAPFGDPARNATSACFSAPLRNGAVGAWAPAAGTGLADRERFVALAASGQVAVVGGLSRVPGGGGAESSSVGSNGDLGAFTLLAGSAAPSALVFDGAGVAAVSRDGLASPRLLLLGGESVAAPGSLTNTVLRGAAP